MKDGLNSSHRTFLRGTLRYGLCCIYLKYPSFKKYLIVSYLTGKGMGKALLNKVTEVSAR